MNEQENKDKPSAQAENNSIAIGRVEVGGNVTGNIIVGGSNVI